MITQQPDPHLSTETIQPDAESEAPARSASARWYADSFRAEQRPAGRAEAHIDFLGLFLHRALAGARRLDSRA